jgi:hypothetical protein
VNSVDANNLRVVRVRTHVLDEDKELPLSAVYISDSDASDNPDRLLSLVIRVHSGRAKAAAAATAAGIQMVDPQMGRPGAGGWVSAATEAARGVIGAPSNLSAWLAIEPLNAATLLYDSERDLRAGVETGGGTSAPGVTVRAGRGYEAIRIQGSATEINGILPFLSFLPATDSYGTAGLEFIVCDNGPPSITTAHGDQLEYAAGLMGPNTAGAAAAAAANVNSDPTAQSAALCHRTLFPLSVLPVNDKPHIHGPRHPLPGGLNQDVYLNGQVFVTDVDADSMSRMHMEVVVDFGTLSLNRLPPDCALEVGSASQTSRLMLDCVLTDLNIALDGLIFHPLAQWHSAQKGQPVTLKFFVDDNGSQNGTDTKSPAAVSPAVLAAAGVSAASLVGSSARHTSIGLTDTYELQFIIMRGANHPPEVATLPGAHYEAYECDSPEGQWQLAEYQIQTVPSEHTCAAIVAVDHFQVCMHPAPKYITLLSLRVHSLSLSFLLLYRRDLCKRGDMKSDQRH